MSLSRENNKLSEWQHRILRGAETTARTLLSYYHARIRRRGRQAQRHYLRAYRGHQADRRAFESRYANRARPFDPTVAVGPEIKARNARIIAALRAYPFVMAVASGLWAKGWYFLPVVAVGEEHRASELPEEIEGVRIDVRFEKDS